MMEKVERAMTQVVDVLTVVVVEVVVGKRIKIVGPSSARCHLSK